jgi:TIR domain/PQQ-like domain
VRGIFISYRRDDTAGYAGRIYEALTAHFGKELVFIDIDSIRAGQNFVDVIEQKIASCSVVIVLIGKAWLNSTDGRGARRLDDPHDFVRLEIVSALRQKIPVIPVLVGGAKMPRPDDLPPPLAPLAHLNAIEIFDQLFRDSLRLLVTALRPLVYPKPAFWPFSILVESRLRIWVLAAALLVTVGVGGFLLSIKPSPNRNDARETAPLPSETLVGPDDSGSPKARVKITTPPDVAELPPIVEASRNVMLPGSSSQVTGPIKPRILWRATVTVGDSWHVIAIAADGTVYVYDDERNVLDAIRDGKEQWAYKAPDLVGFGPLGIAPDGRLWLGNYCFNSRGEGGRVTKKSLLPDRSTLRMGGARRQNTYSCSEGKVFGMDSHGKKTWAVELDGNCGNESPSATSQTGNIYASSDALTLYGITRDGRLLWTVKGACRKSDVNLYPLPNDDLIVSCTDQPLYALREGKPLWTIAQSAVEGLFWSEIMYDASESIYVGVEGRSVMTELVALNKFGNQVWKLSSGTPTMPKPVGFDAQGRLYVNVSERIVSLSQ